MAAQDVALKHGRYFDAAIDGRLFHAAMAVPGATAAFSLHNPLGSGVRLAILVASLAYISGTLGAGVVWHLVNLDPSAAAPTGTAITERPGIVTGGVGQGVALTTATLAVAPAIIRPFCSLQASLASTAVAPWVVNEDVGGAIVLPPGCTYSLHATAAGGASPLVGFGVTWEEIATDAD